MENLINSTEEWSELNTNALFSTLRFKDPDEYVEFGKIPQGIFHTDGCLTVYAKTYDLDVEVHNRLVGEVIDYVIRMGNPNGGELEFMDRIRFKNPECFMDNITILIFDRKG